MHPSEDAATYILGAGPCGLAAARRLATLEGERRSVVVLERNPRPGGLARTFEHGPFRFDVSIHRFQVESPDFDLDLERLFPGEPLHRVTDKTIHIHLRGRRIPYPLQLRSLLSLPPGSGALALLQHAARRLGYPSDSVPPSDAGDYRQWFEGTFGPELYQLVTGPLMQKQWGLPGDRICASFARARRLSVGPRDLFRGLPLLARLAPRAIAPTMVYGQRGAGALMSRLAEELRRGGGALECGVRPVRLRYEGGAIHEVVLDSGQRLPCQTLISTIPLPALAELLDPPLPEPLLARARSLRFRDLMVVALPLRRERVGPDHVTYFPEAGYPFSRTFEPRNASEAMAPPGRTMVGFELPCAAGDSLWSLSDEALVRWMTGFGPDVGFHPGEVEGGSVVRIRDAYPLYEVGHRPAVEDLLGWFHGELHNCFLVGRNSFFRLDNMHHAIRMGLELADHVGAGGDSAAWHRDLRRFDGLSYID